jgi:terminase small subunit / prophage DNA-packing protein
MARKGRGQQVSKTELAEFFGTSSTTVEHWIRVGCPYVQRGGRGKQWIFSTAEVHDWRLDRLREETSGKGTVDEKTLKNRKLAADVERAELELAKSRGEVAPLWQVQKAMAKAFAEVRANMRTIPSRVVSSLIGETDEVRFKAVLLDEIDQALEAMANADLVDDDDLAPEDDDEDLDE